MAARDRRHDRQPEAGTGAVGVEIVIRRLHIRGSNQHQTGDGEEALMLADEEKPDLVILDWMIANLSGIEVCRRLRSTDEMLFRARMGEAAGRHASSLQPRRDCHPRHCPERLQQVRSERRPGSKYASLAQCAYELRQAEQLYRRHNIPNLNSANMSIEEIAAMVMQENPNVEPGTVTAVMQKGYSLHGRVIRPAMVMVAKAPSASIDERA